MLSNDINLWESNEDIDFFQRNLKIEKTPKNTSSARNSCFHSKDSEITTLDLSG